MGKRNADLVDEDCRARPTIGVPNEQYTPSTYLFIACFACSPMLGDWRWHQLAADKNTPPTNVYQKRRIKQKRMCASKSGMANGKVAFLVRPFFLGFFCVYFVFLIVRQRHHSTAAFSFLFVFTVASVVVPRVDVVVVGCTPLGSTRCAHWIGKMCTNFW